MKVAKGDGEKEILPSQTGQKYQDAVAMKLLDYCGFYEVGVH